MPSFQISAKTSGGWAEVLFDAVLPDCAVALPCSETTSASSAGAAAVASPLAGAWPSALAGAA
jgi:hypothetical protein